MNRRTILLACFFSSLLQANPSISNQDQDIIDFTKAFLAVFEQCGDPRYGIEETVPKLMAMLHPPEEELRARKGCAQMSVLKDQVRTAMTEGMRFGELAFLVIRLVPSHIQVIERSEREATVEVTVAQVAETSDLSNKTQKELRADPAFVEIQDGVFQYKIRETTEVYHLKFQDGHWGIPKKSGK